MKLTRKLRDAVARVLDYLSPGESHHAKDLAELVRKLDVEDEPLTIGEVTRAAGVAGWGHHWPTVAVGLAWHEFFRADRRWLARFKDDVLVETQFAPADLLDGRLLAFDTKNKP